jgi:transcriptional regulator with XRE-family HTH domain
VKFPNLVWAIRERGSQFQFAAQLGESESRVSRRLTGRVELTDEERERVARILGFPAHWLFLTPEPPRTRSIAVDPHARIDG